MKKQKHNINMICHKLFLNQIMLIYIIMKTLNIFLIYYKKKCLEFHDEKDTYYNIKLFYQILSYDFLHLYHPCICDIYHDNVLKTENLNKLLTFLDNITRDI